MVGQVSPVHLEIARLARPEVRLCDHDDVSILVLGEHTQLVSVTHDASSVPENQFKPSVHYWQLVTGKMITLFLKVIWLEIGGPNTRGIMVPTHSITATADTNPAGASPPASASRVPSFGGLGLRKVRGPLGVAIGVVLR